MQDEILDHQEEQGLPKELHEGGGAEVDTRRVWCQQERGECMQQAAAAGKKGTTSLSLCMEAFDLEVEEDLPTLATQYWAEGVWPSLSLLSHLLFSPPLLFSPFCSPSL